MTKFRKKPVVIEATQWHNHGDHPAVVPHDPSVSGKHIKGIGPYGWVKTLEGGHIVSPGDWIITGVKGEHYPCKPDIFAATYDAAPSADTSPGAQADQCIEAELVAAGLTFGSAIEALKLGKRVARAGWNGKGMWLCLVQDWDMPDSKLPRLIDDLEALPWIGMKTADNKFVPWLASQTDALAEDFYVVD